MILINSSSKNVLRIFQQFLPIYMPIGVGCLLGIAEKQNIPIHYIDEQVRNDVLGLVVRYLKKMNKPYIFGFSVLTVALKSAISISKELKKLYPDSIIIFGGVHPTAMPEEMLSYDHIDIVVRGEAERILMSLYRYIKEGRDFSILENISYKRNGQFVHNKMSLISEDIDTLPNFPYHLFSSKHYDLGLVMSSRGCPYECIYCSNRVITGKKYRFRRAEAVVDDLENLYKRYNKRQISFVDDDLLVSKDRVYLLIDEIRKRGLYGKMTFNFQTRGDNISYAFLKYLYESGFKSIFIGLETSSEKIMQTLKKNETVAKCIEAVRMVKKIGFHVSTNFIYGLPGETYLDRLSCVKLSRSLGLDMVRYNNATPYPGTKLYEIAKQEKRLYIQGLYENFIPVSILIENPFRSIPLSYIPKNNTEGQIRRDILFGFFSFYFNAARLKNALRRPYEGAEWFNGKENLLEMLEKISKFLLLGLILLFKFIQLFYYSVIKKETAVSLSFFLNVFRCDDKS